ncbi:MAG TPA: lysylphosphatidylglycerol synthase domain-containing protein [Polyangiaceae bacterium]|nr:lysylphosphatidylglycerol synthase domain-containing protein [Polyangiaceae bacterium]
MIEAARAGSLVRTRLVRYRTALTWLTALVLLGFSARILKSNSEPLTSLLTMPAWTWAMMLPLTVLNLAFTAARMALAVRQAGAPPVPAWAWFRIVALGQFLNVLFPQLGNVYRGVALKRQYSVSYFAYSSGLVTFIWLEVVMSLALGLLTVGWLAPGLKLGGLAVLPVLGALLAVVLVAPSLAARLALLFKPRAGLWLRILELSARLLRVTAESRRAPRVLGGFALLNLLTLAAQASVLWLCFRGAGLPIGIAQAALFHIVIRLSNIVIITPGNLGVTELAFGALGAGTHGGSLEHGIAAALAFRALYSLAAVVLGLAFGGVGLVRSLKSEAPEASGGTTPVHEVGEETEQRHL